jgi:uncharacterized protein (DUF1684 family)
MDPGPGAKGGSRFLINFNLAYNPYCAYNDLWSCPLTPFENRLKVAIRAGEKCSTINGSALYEYTPKLLCGKILLSF